LQRSRQDFERQGIAVFALSYDPVDVLASFTEKHGITYPLLSDDGSKVIRELGMLNEHVYEQHAVYGVAPQERHWGTPYPGVFILDERGIVTEKRFHESYRERETGAGILESGFGGHSSIHDGETSAVSGGVSVRCWLDSGTYRYFQRLRLSVELEIEPGLHIYGRPIPEGFIPLSIEVEPAGGSPGEGIIVGEPRLPEPHAFRIDGLDEQFQVYEGTVTCTAPITFAKRDAGDQTLQVTVTYQACSASDCLPPASVTLKVPVKAEAHVS
jgi:hypothetical protein